MMHDILRDLVTGRASELAEHDGVPVKPVHFFGAANEISAMLGQVRDGLMTRGVAAEAPSPAESAVPEADPAPADPAPTDEPPADPAPDPEPEPDAEPDADLPGETEEPAK